MSQSAGKEKERTIGNYIMGKTIGEGTFGKVRLGTHQPTGEKVAIKILEKDKIQEQADVDRVAKEIQILKLLRHPNIIQLYEIIETQKELFLIMEYANGGELFDYIVANQRVKEREACKFFQQIIAGVEYIHKIGVVHRDLKPENLLLDQNQNIKIVDFGLSNTYKPQETLKTACGSPCYAAPEMIAGKRYHGLMVDIWSCGVIMFALICGYLPFEDPNTSQLYKKIIAGDFQIPKYISAEGRDLLKAILCTDPNKRYTIKQIREHPWFKQTSFEEQKGIIVGEDQIRPEEYLIEQLKNQFSIDQAQSRKMVQNNRHNNITTLYYLMQQKNRRSGKKIHKTDEDHSSHQAVQGQQQKVVEPPSQESPINAISEGPPKLTIPDIQQQQLQREIIVKPKLNYPPQKLQFNPITAAVNNSISSVGTNTLTTPIGTARKFDLGKEDSSVDKKHSYTDRAVALHEPHVRRLDQSPVVKSVSQHTEPRSYGNNGLKFQMNTYGGVSGSGSYNQTVNMSYFMQNQTTDQDSAENSVLSKTQQSVRSPQSSSRNKSKIPVRTGGHTPSASTATGFYSKTDIKLHKGPFNLRCVTSRPPPQMIEELIKLLKQMNIHFEQKTRYELSCVKDLIRFEIGLFQLKVESLYLLKGRLTSGDATIYGTFMQNLISTLNL